MWEFPYLNRLNFRFDNSFLFSFQVNATDPDCGLNGQIRYFIAEQALPTVDMFRMEVSTGKLCVAKELDFELQEVYDFPVVAKDNGKNGISPVGTDILKQTVLTRICY